MIIFNPIKKRNPKIKWVIQLCEINFNDNDEMDKKIAMIKTTKEVVNKYDFRLIKNNVNDEINERVKNMRITSKSIIYNFKLKLFLLHLLVDQE